MCHRFFEHCLCIYIFFITTSWTTRRLARIVDVKATLPGTAQLDIVHAKRYSILNHQAHTFALSHTCMVFFLSLLTCSYPSFTHSLFQKAKHHYCITHIIPFVSLCYTYTYPQQKVSLCIPNPLSFPSHSLTFFSAVTKSKSVYAHYHHS